MAIRRILAALLVSCALAPAALASPRVNASVAAARTSSGRRYAPASGRYEITVKLGSPAGSQKVVVDVSQTAQRVVFVTRRRQTRLAFRAAMKRGPVRVRAVGARFRPRVSVQLTRPRARRAPASRSAATRASVPVTSEYGRLVWSDDFTGSSDTAPSSADWIHDVGDYGGGAGEQETYTDSTANAALDGQGHLAIVARPQTPSGSPGEIRSYSSARLETQGLFSASHGLIEARMQIPAGAGLWPAFWMLGDDINTVGWPNCGEIDVMETIGKSPFAVYGTLHGPDGSADGYAIQHQAAAATPLSAGFHTYGVSWSPNAITWLLDGKPYGTVTSTSLAPGQTWAFNQPFHLVLNLAVGGTWPGSPTAATHFPATLLVDWVRVYQ